MKRLLSIILAVCMAGIIPAEAQNIPSKQIRTAVGDTLSARLKRRTTVDSKARINKVLKRGTSLDIYFTNDLGDFPWTTEDQLWFRSELEQEWEAAGGSTIGNIYCGNLAFKELVTPSITNDGSPASYRLAGPDPRQPKPRFITRKDSKYFEKGLSDRYISLWQSHGLYYNEKEDTWGWQRAMLHRTVEDMYTQSYVLPFLIPMLENAGAYVMTPRERDTQRLEIITDNDPSFTEGRGEGVRTSGTYSEEGHWSSAGSGFADRKAAYRISENPFTMGTARQAGCNAGKADATAIWTPEITERGSYAVYVSYKSFPKSNTAARYTVKHMGGETVFEVNQRIGGGTWIYLGTFEFAPDSDNCVMLDNYGPSGFVVSADAVKIGGGMGKTIRGGRTSGMPSYTEGALYWENWAGVDSTLTRQWETDYTCDYSSRGAWTGMMKQDKGIPFDLSLGFHSDAGLTPNDSIIGTLAIYTLLSDGKRKFADGRDRMMSRNYADNVQTQVVNDIRASFEPQWSRRQLWNKSYSESRTTGVPAMILETLSHQNFADMKYGLDPSFRFTVSRAAYKGILKTLSDFYGCSYQVQPLPVNSFRVAFTDKGSAALSWKATPDTLEPTAIPSGYMVYTRVDDGVFDGGIQVDGTSAEIAIEPGHIYSFRVQAYNDGGLSFPSETLAIGLCNEPTDTTRVLVVNNFDRISAPAWIDGEGYAGFDAIRDSGVPYISDISYIGENYEMRRDVEYVDDFNPGFGATHTDRAGEIIAGNTFDFAYVHGRALMQLGLSFCSSSRDAFTAAGGNVPETVIDMICGKQQTTKVGRGAYPDRFEVFPSALREALETYTRNGGNIFISGSGIGSDAQYGRAASFAQNVLGYRFVNSFGTGGDNLGGMSFYNRPNSKCYSVESPDAIGAAGKNAKVVMKYPGNNYPAAVSYDGGKYRVYSIGVPLEVFKEEADRVGLLRTALRELRVRVP